MSKLLRAQSGFTLVELMVVVAIIGVLSAIAVPNFKKYQAKSKTSEGKLQLSAVYTAQQSFYSDYDVYGGCLNFMGFNPTNEIAQRIYVVGFGSGSTAPDAAHTTIMTNNGAGTCGATMDIFAAGKNTGSIAALTTFTAAEGGTTAVDEDTFVAGAVGVIDRNFATAGTASGFSINQAKRLIQVRAGF